MPVALAPGMGLNAYFAYQVSTFAIFTLPYSTFLCAHAIPAEALLGCDHEPEPLATGVL